MIIVLTNDVAPQMGGIQRYMAEIAKALAEVGESVIILAPGDVDSVPMDALLAQDVRRFNIKPIRSLSITIELMRALLKYPRADIVASSWFPAGAIAVLFPRILRGNVLILVHGKEIAVSGLVRDRIMRFVISRADTIAANGNFTRDVAARRFPCARIDIVGCGVNQPDGPPRASRQNFVLSVGRLVKRKGFDTVLKAMPSILHDHPDIRYRLVGEGPDENRLRNLARDLDLTNSVDFLGAIDDEQLRLEYEKARCFVMPCRSIGGDIEGFGLVFLEAAAHGVPSVIGRQCGAADAIGDVSIVVDGNDSEAVALAIGSLLSNHELAAELGTAARARVIRDFGWVEVAQRILAILKT